jgi:hypothetical protein
MVRAFAHAASLRAERLDGVVVHRIDARDQDREEDEQAGPLHPGDHEG